MSLHHPQARAAFLAFALASLPACGGGSSPPPPAAPANRAPQFTSPSQVSVNENVTGVIYTFTATDPDGDPITYAIVPGGDEGVFEINLTARTIALTQGLDFEAPQDATGNNVYIVTIEANDGRGGTARLRLEIRVLNVPEGMSLRRAGTGFSQPLYLAGLPGTGRVVVLEKGGRARVLDPESGAIEGADFLNLSGQIATDSERGLLGLAFSPDFASDRVVFVNLTNSAGDTEVRRYQTFPGNSLVADPASAELVLRIAQPFANHNGGWIGFGPDGLLYIPTGDGGSGGDPQNNAQNPNSLLGKVLRIDVSADDFPSDALRNYRIPSGNAFPGGAGGAPEIFALGLRNPWRASFDTLTGDLFIGDVGQNAIEEVNRMRSGDAGANYGWRLREGTQPYNGGANSAAFTPPVTEYTHGTGPAQGRSVTGGYAYRGNIEPIKDRYVFGDFISGNIWSVPVSDLVPGQTLASSAYTRLNGELVPDAGATGNISSFGVDNDGRLYIVSFGGSVFRIEDAP
jgi:glucose/arabinose dehydrogenase